MTIGLYQRIKPLFTNIRFWLLLFFVVRLIGITHPPLDSHNWRQSLTNMVARNFYEDKADLRYPTIDIAGEKSGVMTSEFPVYNYLTYTAAKVFGYTHWYGRLISLIVSTIGLFCFYQLIAQLINTKVALYATLITLGSLWFAYGRKSMPDAFSVSLVFMGLYAAYHYLRDGKLLALLAFFVLTTLGILSKIPALSLCAVFVILPWLKSVRLTRKIWLGVAGVVGLTLVYVWYFCWLDVVYSQHQYQLFFPKTLSQGFKEIVGVLPGLFEKFYFSSLNSFIGFGCFVAGIVVVIQKKDRNLQAALLAISVVFALFIVKTGSVFPTHSYYIVPFAPIMALVAAYFLQILPKKVGGVVLGLIVLEGVANQQHDLFIRESQVYKLELESTIQDVIPKDDLVAINGGPSPQLMYFAHRKGWALRNSEAQDAKLVDSLQKLGAKFLIIDKHQSQYGGFDYKLVFGNKHFDVYQLKAR